MREARSLEPEWDPGLVEAAVLAAMRGGAEASTFHAERDGLYELGDPEAREAAFAVLHARWFARRALDRPLREALALWPDVAANCARCLVTRARDGRDEGGDLLVAPGTRPVLSLRVCPETVAAPDRLRLLLRREVLHVADMLAPPFGYEPALPERVAGRAGERAVRDRYRVVWNTYVDGRLVRAGLLPAAARAERLRDFGRAFSHLGDAVEATFERCFGAPELTHADLLGLAAGDCAGAPPARCRLCDMPARALHPAPDRLPRAALAAIAGDFPSWRPADGLCDRCAELYTSRLAAHA
jgi:hypothetical protein